jgi:hypothetical protein
MRVSRQVAWCILCRVLALFVLITFLIGAFFPGQGPTNDLGQRGGRQEEANCGIMSLWAVCQLLGEPVQVEQIVELTKGETMYDLFVGAQKLGLHATGLRVRDKRLTPDLTPCIAFVKGNHFLVVDKIAGGKVSVLDFPSAPSEVSEKEFLEIWDGHILSFYREPFPSGETFHLQAAHIRFESLFQNLGIITWDRITSCTFRFQNTGDEILEVIGVSAGCSCAGAEVSASTFAPGKTGDVSISYDTTGRKGYVEEVALVYTNDPLCPEIPLRFTLIMKPQILVIPRELSFEDVPRGCSAVNYIMLLDESGGNVKITGAETDSSFLGVSAYLVNLGETNVTMEPSLLLQARCLIRVELKPGLPEGKFTFHITVRTSNKDAPAIRVPAHVEMVPDLIVLPPLLVFSSRDVPGTIKTCVLKSRTARPFEITRIDLPCEWVTSKGCTQRNRNELELDFKIRQNVGQICAETVAYIFTTHPDVPVVKLPICLIKWGE